MLIEKLDTNVVVDVPEDEAMRMIVAGVAAPARPRPENATERQPAERAVAPAQSSAPKRPRRKKS